MNFLRGSTLHQPGFLSEEARNLGLSPYITADTELMVQTNVYDHTS